jgi:hypothetical protein
MSCLCDVFAAAFLLVYALSLFCVYIHVVCVPPLCNEMFLYLLNVKLW